ncbi:cytochrome c oxidase assembly protein COX19 [Magnaporthiopsis poae ATCC 64411]|uniref:Cytochrome c oxidase assembly protein COX19 n=1 Tax=Magnaporthiopsis poae (strain ATCC 64411 / 73-15) TaxID=644358 RepID=A0A0C4E6X8_MAGP6|nr:cytochrome c oxidase assembly protein COX19 [Magnaporthiopsis poae ATCC 64411]
MSAFGGPGGGQLTQKPTPPQRGSFPLDHDGECKHVMETYLSCMKRVKGVNDSQCRDIAKSYLACRMDRNLMARDDFKNLGFKEDSKPEKKPAEEECKKGELRW